LTVAVNCLLQGYWRKKCKVLNDVLTEGIKKEIKDLESELKDENITEV
jgi:hypothetical protein